MSFIPVSCPSPGEQPFVADLLLCDDNGTFIRKMIQHGDGTVVAVVNLTVDGTPYVPVGTVHFCGTGGSSGFDVESLILCDDNGGFIRRYTFDEATGAPTSVTTTDFAGNPYVPVGTVHVCDANVAVTEFEAELVVLCDNNGPFIRRFTYNEETQAQTVADITLAGAPYAAVGPVVVCSTSSVPVDVEEITVCAWYTANFRAPAIKRTVYLNGVAQPPVFLGDDGVVFDPTLSGPVPAWSPGDCNWDSEFAILCDNNGPFIRYYTTRDQSNIWSVSNFTLLGSAYTPVGPVIVCPTPATVFPTEFDQELLILCDNNGAFIRRFGYDEQTQAQTVTNLTLAGAPYVPVGTVVVCGGTTTLPNVAAHHFDVLPGTPWTPAAIPAGRLVGISYSVVLGTVTTVDADGTSIAGLPTGLTEQWNVQDDRETLTPPQSITAAAVSRAIVTMVVATP